jgi:DNA-binding transcriptional regulator YiaG
MQNLDIKKLREMAGLSQMALAAKIGVSLNSVVKWEKGGGRPSEANYKKLLKLKKQNEQKNGAN